MTAPTITSSTPAASSFGNDDNVVITFVLNAGASTVNSSTLNVLVDNLPAVVAGAFQTGFTGTITPSGSNTTVTIETHPTFGHPSTSVYIDVKDASADEAQLSVTFNVTVETITDLIAKSWCDGNRIDLFWTNPDGITKVKIRRSQYSFCKFITDPGTDIYTGTPISAYVDGPGPVPATYPGGTPQSTTPLAENTFYYYSIFVCYDSAGTQWVWSANCQVEGLSIKDYYSYYGDYVYNWLPRNYRQKDADPSRGSDQFLLKNYCRVLQCAVNLYRGWLEGIGQLRDPDTMPAGRLGDANNQTGILQALSWDLGIPPEKAFDAGVLRRIAMGLIPVYKEKGTCQGLIDLTKLFTTWDSTCVEAIEPECGVDRLFWTYDTISVINDVVVAANSNNPTIVAGSVTLKTSTIFLADGVTPATIPDYTAGIPTVAFILDAMGTFGCVSQVDVAAGGSQEFVFDNASTVLRSSIAGSGTGASGQFTITSINTSSYPWQFPSSGGFAAPTFGSNAWAGYHLKDSGGTVYPITASAATSAGTTVLTVTGTPASGTFTLAYTFDGSGNPLFSAKLYTGEFSLIMDPKWDIRLNNELYEGPWSEFTGLGAINILGYAPSPADVTVWAENVASVSGYQATSVTTNSLSDSTKTWTSNEWAGYYLLPNWNQTKVFKILGNNASTLLVGVPSGGGVSTVSIVGSYYVILSEVNAIMYSRLISLLPSFLPVGTNGFVKFN